MAYVFILGSHFGTKTACYSFLKQLQTYGICDSSKIHILNTLN